MIRMKEYVRDLAATYQSRDLETLKFLSSESKVTASNSGKIEMLLSIAGR